MRQFKWFSFVLVFIFISLMSAGCGSNSTQSTTGAAKTTNASGSADNPSKQYNIKIGTSTGYSYLPVFVAKEKGYFKEQGINADIILFNGGAEVTNAMLGGSIDFGATTSERPIVLAEKGMDAKNIVSLQNKMDFTLIVNKNLQIQNGDIKGLKGLKLGVTKLGGGIDQTLRALLQDAGLDPDKDVHIIAVGSVENMVSAIEAKSIDGALSPEPATSIALQRGIAKSIMDFRKNEGPASIQSMTFATLQATSKFIEKNQDMIQRIVTAIAKAEKEMRSNPDVAISSVKSQFPDMDDKLIKDVLQAEKDLYHAPITPDMVKAMTDSFKGNLKQPITYEKITATEFKDLWKQSE